MSLNDQPNPYAPSEGAPVARTGRVSLIVALIAVGVQLVFQVVLQFAPIILRNAGLDASSFVVITLPFQLVTVALALTAVLLGIGPLTRPGPKGSAGAGVGIGGAYLLSAVFGFLVPPLVSLFY